MHEPGFLRAIGLTAVNEARLLRHDPVALLMMLVAPVVIITVAGYSLGALYGGNRPIITVPVVDHDGGQVAAELMREGEPGSGLRFEAQTDLEAVRRGLILSGTSPLAIEVPTGTRQRILDGDDAQLVLYVDPARRLAANALELELGVLQRRAAARVRTQTRRELMISVRDLRHQLRRLAAVIRQERRRIRSRLAQAERDSIAAGQARLKTILERSKHETETALHLAQTGAADDLRGQLESRAAAFDGVRVYLQTLATTRQRWEDWLVDLQTLAASHGAKIPPPPELPAPPSEAELAKLTQPLVLPPMQLSLPPLIIPNVPASSPRDITRGDDDSLRTVVRQLRAAALPTLPGALDLVERPAIDGASMTVNAFNEYVPGFGVTFLLIGMMMGVALTLYDERDWGTLERIQAGGASLAGILVGKVFARVVVGIVQMIVLFGVGWLLFDISLGRQPAILLLPMASMALAGASLGLVIASIATAHDSVMPLGTMTSLALSAIGGCWWPLDFEPAWMRTVADWLPTTWTMQAFNDLMIRGAPPSAAIQPFLITTSIGFVLLAVGVSAGLRRRA